MFSENRSDFAVPITGFLIIAFISLFYGINALNAEFEFFDDFMGTSILMIVSLFGIIVSGFALYKAYIVEGLSFGLLSIFAMVSESIIPGYGMTLGIIFLVFFAVFAFMSYRGGLLDLAIIDALLGISAFILLGFDVNLAVPAILTLIAGAIALYVSVCDWMFVQDIADEYAEAMYGDDCCCCGDDDCCCDDDCDDDECTCGCHHND